MFTRSPVTSELEQTARRNGQALARE